MSQPPPRQPPPRQPPPHSKEPRYLSVFPTTVGEPPFDFTNVIARVFPLQASYSRLQSVCDAYLNIVPPAAAWFRPAAPFVYLAVLDYGRMSSELARARYGWIAQNEVFFAIPLEQYREENGRLVFQGWASVSPFIFVDDAMSRTTGREVYGWPKESAWFGARVSSWAQDPQKPENLLALRTQVFAAPYAGTRAQPRTLLEIDRAAPSTVTVWPPQWQSPDNPLFLLPRAMQNMLGLAQDWMATWLSPPWRSPGAWAGRISSGLAELRRVGGAGLSFPTINLKQFPDTEQPEFAAYQALTTAAMRCSAFHRGGMLGEPAILRGDPSGGYRIRLHRYAAYPIIETLGLHVIEESAHEDHHETAQRGVTAGSTGYTRLDPLAPEQQAPSRGVAELAPIFPYWVDADLTYGAPSNLCWRDKATRGWRWPGSLELISEKIARHHAGLPGRALAAAARERSEDRPLYNTSIHGYAMTPGPPYHFPNVTLRVLLLEASEERLARHCDTFLNVAEEDAGRFEPWGSWVMLVIASFEEMSAESNDLGWWEERQIGFYIPVKRSVRGREQPELGLSLAFGFAHSEVAIITDREVSGQPMFEGRLDSPPDVWMSDAGPEAHRGLLRVSTEVYPSLMRGAEARERVLLEVVQGPILPDWDREKAALLRNRPQADLSARAALFGEAERAWLDERIRQQQIVPMFHLRQIRDTDDFGRACFQALLETHMRMQVIAPLQGDPRLAFPIQDPLQVRIHHYPSYPIVEKLGLTSSYREQIKSALANRAWEGALVDCIEPLAGFWLKASITQERHRELGWRTHDKQWHQTHPPADPADPSKSP